MKRLVAGVFGLTAIACLSSAAPSFGAVSCTFSPPDNLLSVSATDAFTRVVRTQESIQIDDGHQVIDCARGNPTVRHTDLVQVSHTGRSADTLDLSGGPLAPGFTDEATGIPEIELQYLTPTFLDVRGSAAPDRLAFGAGGANLNGDDDTDVTGQFTVLLIEGRDGDDLISPQSDYTTAASRRVLLGEAGQDTLIATPDGSNVHGGNGRDMLIGGPGHDNLTGGRESDVLRGAKGRDLIRAIDGTRDRVNCGVGLDSAKVDGIDKVKGCERLIAVKRTEPVSRR
jgi:Ca2+-binding RTX toxin-like protein